MRSIDIANELEYSKPSVSRAVGILDSVVKIHLFLAVNSLLARLYYVDILYAFHLGECSAVPAQRLVRLGFEQQT